MTHYPKFFLDKGRILALWHFAGNRLLLLKKNALMKGDKKIGQNSPPPLIWTKSKRTATFFS